MKQFKLDILKKIEEESIGCKVISLKEQANKCGIKHLKAQECLEIADAFLKNHNYEIIRMMNTPNDSIFCSLTFVDKTLESEE